jgi:hypothetical protein
MTERLMWIRREQASQSAAISAQNVKEPNDMLKCLWFDVHLSGRRGVDLTWLCNDWSHEPKVTGPSTAVRDVISDVSHKP